MVTLDSTHSFENNSVTAYCNIRYQILLSWIYLLMRHRLKFTMRLHYKFSSF